jgi:GT2 family glycosyltransferase
VVAAEPGLSVVVPACGRTRALERCLAALAAQTRPVEVVVSIDGSDPSTAAVQELAPPGLALRVIQAAQTGPAGARNRGGAAATAPLLAFVDDDCEPSPGWAAALAAQLERDPDALVGGPLLNAFPRDASAAASQAVIDALYEVEPFLVAANLGVRRDRFQALGGFDERFPTAAGEDRELCARAREHGLSVVRVGEATVLHHRQSRPSQLWRQHVEYGRGARLLAHLRAEQGRPPVRAGRGFRRALARAAVRAAREGRAPAVIPLVGLTQVAVAYGYFSSPSCSSRR